LAVVASIAKDSGPDDEVRASAGAIEFIALLFEVCEESQLEHSCREAACLELTNETVVYIMEVREDLVH
jgi:hypothetical protein